MLKIAITADPAIPVPPVLYGGIERIIELLVTGLNERGHEVTLFAHKDSLVPSRLISYRATGHTMKDTLFNSWRINKVLLRDRFDIIHNFGRLAYISPQLPFSTPKLMSYQREPTISQIRKAVKLSAAGTLAFTGCSDYITNKIKPVAEATTVYNAIDTLKYVFSARVDSDAPLVFLGRIEPIKGTHTAIEVALKTNRRLVIAGNIPENGVKYFNEKIKPMLSDRIVYAGPVDDIEKNNLLQNALALLMPIYWDEPFGIVMIEAMACGTPVIGYNRGAVPEVIEHGVTGFVGKNTLELICSVEKAHTLDRERIRSVTEIRFSADVIVDQYLTIYKDMISRN